MAASFKRYQIASIVFLCYVVKEGCQSWLDVVRTFPLDAKEIEYIFKTRQKGSFINNFDRINNTLIKQTCYKDRQCSEMQFCSRHKKNCVNCRKTAEKCNRNKMCCRGYECINSQCKKKRELSKFESICNKDRDCEYGLCCIKQAGHSVCKEMQKDGDLCTINGDLKHMTNQCPCINGFICKPLNSTFIENIFSEKRLSIFGRCTKIF
ncbi:dickkopf-related protein 3 isoform X1 [Hydra vulgaris]|uniref:dickkopf-related protein 3 isoform X1 n=1 Tax=Hydra vulgaris TaxID=6087 RepID=UPI001F5EAC91|nr:dickkopf-related protein 3 isoform X1 [Hydra vulgaris]